MAKLEDFASRRTREGIPASRSSEITAIETSGPLATAKEIETKSCDVARGTTYLSKGSVVKAVSDEEEGLGAGGQRLETDAIEIFFELTFCFLRLQLSHA